MSKAFTRESDDSGAEETPVVRTRLPVGARNYITRDGADRLERRLAELLKHKQELTSARTESGMTSEVERKRTEAAIREVQQTLDSVVVAETPADQEKIAFGATVRVRHGN